MNRRDFVAASVGGVVAADVLPAMPVSHPRQASVPTDVRDMFPRLQHDVFLNAAGGTPLSTFAEAGLRQYEEFWRLGPGNGRGQAVATMLTEVRAAFARLIGADPEEIAFVQCTKAGEQIVLDGLPGLRNGGNVVTNAFHFSGSLHNLIGLRDAGLDVRIVKDTERQVTLAAMEAAIDDRTALVDVTLVSNINGRVEPVRELSDRVHSHGGLLFADIIQAAGIVPIDVRAMGIDFAACSGYKWLYGPHGVGFFYVRKELQGAALPDHLFPGHVRHNYPPWVAAPDTAFGDFTYRPPTDARRYQPGHVSYLGLAALSRGLEFLEEIGVEEARVHSVRLALRLTAGLDGSRYRSISPDPLVAPIATFEVDGAPELEDRLRAANMVIAVGGNTIRISPAIYNNEDDIDRLVEVLNG